MADLAAAATVAPMLLAVGNAVTAVTGSVLRLAAPPLGALLLAGPGITAVVRSGGDRRLSVPLAGNALFFTANAAAALAYFALVDAPHLVVALVAVLVLGIERRRRVRARGRAGDLALDAGLGSGYLLDMTDPLDLVHLRTLVEIADCGGFHRAAAALHLSQSTVSQHVRALEKVFRAPLVHKAGRGTAFTPAGDALLVEARRILAVHDQALQRLEVATDPVITLGVTEHAADQLLPGLLAALRDAFPERGVRFRIARSTSLEEEVARGVLDLAIVLASGQPSGAEIGQLKLSWYAGYDFAVPDPAQPWPIVAFEEPCGLRQRALQALHELGRTTVIAAESGSLEGVAAAVRAGVGVALLPGTGRKPEGLRVLDGLPDLGSIGLQVVARRGVDQRLEQEVSRAGRTFLAGVTLLHRISA